MRACAVPPPPAPLPVALTSGELGVPGLQLLPDFISPTEEAGLMQAVALGCWAELAKRRVQHYGYVFDYAVSGLTLEVLEVLVLGLGWWGACTCACGGRLCTRLSAASQANCAQVQMHYHPGPPSCAPNGFL